MIIAFVIVILGIQSNETINYQHCKRQGFESGTYIKLVSRGVKPCSHYKGLAQFDKTIKQ